MQMLCRVWAEPMARANPSAIFGVSTRSTMVRGCHALGPGHPGADSWSPNPLDFNENPRLFGRSPGLSPSRIMHGSVLVKAPVINRA